MRAVEYSPDAIQRQTDPRPATLGDLSPEGDEEPLDITPGDIRSLGRFEDPFEDPPVFF